MDGERDTNTQTRHITQLERDRGRFEDFFSMESFRLIRKLTRVEGGEERMKGVADELEAQRYQI